MNDNQTETLEDEDYLVRDAVIQDLPVLLEFEQEIIKVERPFDPTIRLGHVNYYDLREFIMADDATVCVVEHNGNIVSSGYALRKRGRHYLDHDYYAHLGFMYTVPEHRGRGLNQLIIQALQDWARENGLLEIRLTVYEGNDPAIRAYEKIGLDKHIIEMRMRLD